MRKILLLLLLASSAAAAQAQTFDTMRVRAAVLSSPFDPSPRYIDTLVLAVKQVAVCAAPVFGVDVPVPDIIAKYAALMGVEPSALKSEKIYEFIDRWLGTPYRYGGNGERGIDCSGLTRALYDFVADLVLPRSSRDMYASDMVEALKDKDESSLREGDLLFFRSKGRIYHVAVYLCDGKFLSANRTGVEISDLDLPYWKKHFYSAARVKENPAEGKVAELR